MQTHSETPARLLRIRGLVQGVGYRNALLREATRLGLSGWVRNRSDGSVEALAAGPAPALDGLIAWARRGPPAAGQRGELGGHPGARRGGVLPRGNTVSRTSDTNCTQDGRIIAVITHHIPTRLAPLP